MRSYLVSCAVAVGTCLALAGCASGNNNSSGGSGTPSAAAGSAGAGADSPSPGGASGSATPAVQPAGQRCHTNGLKITSHALGAAAGNHYAALVFTNVSGNACRVYGYPGMQLQASGGKKIPTNVVRDPSTTPTLVTLAAGAAAWSRVSWAAIPGDGEPSTGNCETDPASTEVTPPDETAHEIIKWPYGPACLHGRLLVTPLAPGTGSGQ